MEDEQIRRIVKELSDAGVSCSLDDEGRFVFEPNDLALLLNHFASADNRWQFIPFINQEGHWVS